MKRLFSYYFPTPSYLAMNSCAIDISDQSIKYGELSATSSGLRLLKYGKEKIPKGIVVSGKIEKEDELVRILKKIKEKEKIHFIRVSLPEEQVYLFTLSLPKINDNNLREMILLQIEEHIPLKAPDVLFEYDVINEDYQNTLVEVVAIANTTMDSYLSVFNKAGLVPISFELEAQAIARAVIPTGDNNPVMVVDFGDSKTGISISNNGRVFLTTTLSIGGTDLTNMIAKNFSLSFTEAEKMKHDYGLDNGSKAKDIFSAILNGISVLRDELNKQYIYWGTHNGGNTKNNQINHIILCGGDANLAGLSDYLELSMKVKVENANVWVNILNKENFVPEMSFEESLGYATVIGLALGGYVFEEKSVINILPDKEKKFLIRGYWMRFFTILFSLLTLTGAIATLLLIPPYLFSQSKESIAINKLEVFNRENSELVSNNVDQITLDINSKLKILDQATTPYQANNKIIKNIISSRTSGIIFSQIIFNKTTITKTKATTKTVDIPTLEVRGIATNRDTLRNFKTSLDNNPNFSEVNLPISDFLEKSNLPFTISITIKE